MTSERYTAILLKAAQRRKRQVLMGPGHLAAWMRGCWRRACWIA